MTRHIGALVDDFMERGVASFPCTMPPPGRTRTTSLRSPQVFQLLVQKNLHRQSDLSEVPRGGDDTMVRAYFRVECLGGRTSGGSVL